MLFPGGALPPDPITLLAQELLRLYNVTLEVCIGGGAQGGVYRCRLPDGTLAAVKVPNQGGTLIQEGGALVRVHSANVVRLLDPPLLPVPSLNLVCLVTELCDTDLHRALHARWDGTPFAALAGAAQASAMCELGAQLLRGLIAVHSAGIAHRDVKPANCLLLGSVLKLADLGMHKDIGPESVSRDHSLVGTPPYSAPELRFYEQVNTAPHYSQRADLYSAGLVLTDLAVSLGAAHPEPPLLFCKRLERYGTRPPPQGHMLCGYGLDLLREAAADEAVAAAAVTAPPLAAAADVLLLTPPEARANLADAILLCTSVDQDLLVQCVQLALSRLQAPNGVTDLARLAAVRTLVRLAAAAGLQAAAGDALAAALTAANVVPAAARASAARGLRSLGLPALLSALPSLLRAALTDQAPEVRMAVVYALGGLLGQPEFFESDMQVLTEDGTTVMITAYSTLQRMHQPAAHQSAAVAVAAAAMQELADQADAAMQAAA